MNSKLDPKRARDMKETIDRFRGHDAAAKEVNAQRAQTVKHARKQKLDARLLAQVARILDSSDPLAFDGINEQIKEILDIYASFGLPKPKVAQDLRASTRNGSSP